MVRIKDRAKCTKICAHILLISALLLSSGPFLGLSQASVPAGLAGTASIIPGLGQVIQGEVGEGLVWGGSIFGLLFVGVVTPKVGPLFFQAGFDLWMYNMYDAYRDAKPECGYTTNYNLFENWVGAVNPVNFWDLYGAPMVSVAGTISALNGFPGLTNPLKPLTYSLVGLGEEGLFRGFLFPAFSDLFGSRIVGGIVSSAMFSLAHITGGSENMTGRMLGGRFIMGALFALQTNHNNFDLRRSIFAHTWWDVFIDPSGKIDGVAGKMKIPF